MQHARREPGAKIGFCNFYSKLSFAARSRQLRLGRFVPISISKTVSSPEPLIASTAMPAAVRSSASRRSSTRSSTKSRIHCGESFISGFQLSAISFQLFSCPRIPLGSLRAESFSPKLLQKPDITLEEQLNVIHAVL